MPRLPIAPLIALLLVACAWRGDLSTPPGEYSSVSESPVIADAEACAAALSRPHAERASPLTHDTIHLFNWNIQKQTDSDLQADMTRLAQGADLILLQEATRNIAAATHLRGSYHNTFAPGFKTSRVDTGVMTASKAPPLTQCSFSNIEPWLRSPKATNVTQYSLANRADTLLVVNLHLINFTFGVSDVQSQLDEALRLIERHRGPVIVSGDFNTWSHSRESAVGEALRRQRLDPVRYEADLRKRVFGHALDHVYTRGMEVIASTSFDVDSSDHNPMSVTLRLRDEFDREAKSDVDPS